MIDKWLDILHWYHHGVGEFELGLDVDGKRHHERQTILGFLDRCNHKIFYKIEAKIMILWKQ